MGFHRLTINRRAFEYIRCGLKTIEGRLKKGYFLTNPIIPGDTISFINNDDEFTMWVSGVNEFLNISDCINTVSIDSISPYLEKPNEILSHYSKFYSKKQLNDLPFIAIDLKMF